MTHRDKARAALAASKRAQREAAHAPMTAPKPTAAQIEAADKRLSVVLDNVAGLIRNARGDFYVGKRRDAIKYAREAATALARALDAHEDAGRAILDASKERT